jgi:uncharacterized phage protein (TIGR01671 family)
MRTIKFRAYIKKESVMVDVESIDFIAGYITHENLRRDNANDLEPRSQTDALCMTDFADLELMQFTGLLDKNGKEIYEGDIVKYFDSYQVYLLATVKFIDSAFVIQHDGMDDDYIELADFHLPGVSIEVIGNIYQNPELLKCN